MSELADLLPMIEQQLALVAVDTMDSASVHEACRTVARVRGLLDGFEASLVQRTAMLHARGVAPTPDEVLAKAGRVPGRQARQAAARAEIIGALPELVPALADAAISTGHADVLARVAGRLDDPTREAFLAEGALLVGAARRLTPETFERHCKRLADSMGDTGLGEFERQRRQTRLRHWIDQHTGMYILHAELDPETGAAVFTALDTHIEELFHTGADGTAVVPGLANNNEHLAAHALAQLIHHGQLTRTDGPITAEVTVLIDHQTLTGELHQHGVCELTDGTAITPDTARRIACDAAIIPVVLGGDGIPLDVGRARRLATRQQRQALRAMYPTCAFDDCDIPHSRCQPHHLHPWETGGPTNLPNLTKADGNSRWPRTAPSPSPDPTAPSTRPCHCDHAPTRRSRRGPSCDRHRRTDGNGR
jgi:hypothetical protein